MKRILLISTLAWFVFLSVPPKVYKRNIPLPRAVNVCKMETVPGQDVQLAQCLNVESSARLGTEMFRWNVTVIGAAGISAFPMAGRIAAKMAHEEDPDNFILMHAMGANTAGQLGSVIAGGILLSVVSKMMGL